MGRLRSFGMAFQTTVRVHRIAQRLVVCSGRIDVRPAVDGGRAQALSRVAHRPGGQPLREHANRFRTLPAAHLGGHLEPGGVAGTAGGDHVAANRRRLNRDASSETPRTDADGPQTRAVLSAEDAASAFNAVLDALSRVIPPVLIDDAGWSRLRDAVAGLPVGPSNGFGFELRLGEPAAGADFYVVLPRRGALADHLIRRGEGAAPGSAAAGLRSHLAAIDTGAPWSEILGLEYDVMSSPRVVRPGLFVRMRSDIAQTGADGFPTAQTVAEWLAGAVGWRLSEGERHALGLVFDGFAAAGGKVADVGIIPDRPVRALKVVSRPLEPTHVLPVLSRLRWPGPAGEVAAFLSAFAGLFRTLRLAVGVAAEGVLPRIGLELFQGEPGSFGHPASGEWGPFLARLCEDGLCLPGKSEGLLALPGRELVFRRRDAFGILTAVHHIKVSFEEREGGVALDAKAYPAAAYLPFDTIVSRARSR